MQSTEATGLAARSEPEQGWGTGYSVAELLLRWQRASERAGWVRPADWPCPEADAVAEAVSAARDAAPACARLGAARAREGVGLQEALDDLDALFSVLPFPETPVRLVRRLAEAWAEESVAPAGSAGCADPLTGLPSAAYLHIRLAELYQAGEQAGRPVGATHALLVAVVPEPGAGFEGLQARLDLGQVMRSVFCAGEPVAVVGRGTAVAVVRRGPAAAILATALRHELGGGARVWQERLPGGLPAAHDLLAGLVR